MFPNLFTISKKNWSPKFIYRTTFSPELFICNVSSFDAIKKNIVSENLRKNDSKLRVVIATNAFGMGVNVPDIQKVLHWGASRSVQGFMQESGRAGRDNKFAVSVVYYHPVDISATIYSNR